MPSGTWRPLKLTYDSFNHLPNDHPFHIAARTYALSLSLSLGPAIISALGFTGDGRLWDEKRIRRLHVALKKEVSFRSFATSMTLAVAGGAALDHYWGTLSSHEPPGNGHTHSRKDRGVSLISNFPSLLSCIQKLLPPNTARTTFLFNILTALLAILFMQSDRRSPQTHKTDISFTLPIASLSRSGKTRNFGRTSPTLDLSLLLFVRSLDAGLRRILFVYAEKAVRETDKESSEAERKRAIKTRARKISDVVDTLAFAVASGRIMFCFFYLPHRLPKSYLKWIGAMANVDSRLMQILLKISDGTWAYGRSENKTLLTEYARDRGFPSPWGDPTQVPKRGGTATIDVWRSLGVTGRDGLGGIPCELVHNRIGAPLIPGGVQGSCTGNALVRAGIGFLEGLALYAPVHFLPTLLSRPRSLLKPQTLKTHVLALCRSSTFLSTFISSFYAAVCFTRTLVIARIFPQISHNFYDGPFGCIMAGCLTCGWSIFLEQKKRRGEMALYTLPRALRTLVTNSWLRSGSRTVKLFERIMFVLSLASILTAYRYHPNTLRGLSRSLATFVMHGRKSKAHDNDHVGK